MLKLHTKCSFGIEFLHSEFHLKFSTIGYVDFFGGSKIRPESDGFDGEHPHTQLVCRSPLFNMTLNEAQCNIVFHGARLNQIENSGDNVVYQAITLY